MTTTVDSTQTSAKDGDTNKTETSGEQPVKQVDKSVILSTGSLPDGTKYHVRRMTFDDIEEVLKVWESIGLYEGTNSIQTFLTVDPEGFYVAINEKDGSIIGEVGAVFIEPSTAFIGLYAVRPDHQKMGVGYAVWKQMMKHVGDKNVGLYAIDTQYDMYRYKAGLGIEDDVKIIEFKMTKETSPETLDNLISTLDNVELVQVNRNDEIVNKIIEYDQTIVGHDRSRLIPLIISEPDALCLAAIEKMSGSILGSCAGVFVDPSVAFIGLYAVRPAYQGKGIGTNMFKQMLNHIGDKNVGLYAVPEQIETYRDKAGFRVEDTIKVLEYEGTQLKTDDLVTKLSNIEIKNITEDEILKQKVINYDESVVNFDRASLLKLTFTEHGSLAMVAIDKDNGSIVGYGCIRTNNINRAMAGPIYASNDAVAELIVYNLITNLPVALSAGLDFMTPDCNPGGLRIAAKLGLKKNLDLPRFFTKSVPKVDWNRIYCIHTPNFSPY